MGIHTTLVLWIFHLKTELCCFPTSGATAPPLAPSAPAPTSCPAPSGAPRASPARSAPSWTAPRGQSACRTTPGTVATPSPARSTPTAPSTFALRGGGDARGGGGGGTPGQRATAPGAPSGGESNIVGSPPRIYYGCSSKVHTQPTTHPK